MSCNEHNHNHNGNVICATLRSIDQKQKEVLLESSCITCENALFTTTYNTIPISIYLCNGTRFAAALSATTDGDDDCDDVTHLFRVEEVYDCNAVKLRLIQEVCPKNPEMECTNQTCIVKIDCICCLECFSPILCQPCNNTMVAR